MPWNDALNLHPRAAEFSGYEQWAGEARRAERLGLGGFAVGVRDLRIIAWHLGEGNGRLSKVWEATRDNPAATAELEGGYEQFLASIARSRHQHKAHLVESALAPERSLGLPLTSRRIVDVASFLEEDLPIPLHRSDAGAEESVTEAVSPIGLPGSAGSRPADGLPGGSGPNCVEPATAPATPSVPAPSLRYQYSWNLFVRWCGEHNESPWPASGAVVARFLRDRAPFRAYLTLQSDQTAISNTHKSAGKPDPCDSSEVKLVLNSVRPEATSQAWSRLSPEQRGGPLARKAIWEAAVEGLPSGAGLEETAAVRRKRLSNIALYTLSVDSGLSCEDLSVLKWESLTLRNGDPCVLIPLGAPGACKVCVLSEQAFDDLEALSDYVGQEASIFPRTYNQIKSDLAKLKALVVNGLRHVIDSTDVARAPTGGTSASESATIAGGQVDSMDSGVAHPAEFVGAGGKTVQDSSRRVYARLWQHYCHWCEEQGDRRSLPASAETVAAYLRYAAQKYSVSGVGHARSAIAGKHRAAGVENPCQSALVAETMRQIRIEKSPVRQPASYTGATPPPASSTH